jgi:hypothetical protein
MKKEVTLSFLLFVFLAITNNLKQDILVLMLI